MDTPTTPGFPQQPNPTDNQPITTPSPAPQPSPIPLAASPTLPSPAPAPGTNSNTPSFFGSSANSIFVASIVCNIVISPLLNRHIGGGLAIIAFILGFIMYMKEKGTEKKPSFILLLGALFFGLFAGIGALSM